MRLELKEGIDLSPDFEPLWERLIEECGADPIFSCFTWVNEWWHFFRQKRDKLRLGLLKYGDTVVGLANLYGTEEQWGPFTARVLAPLGWSTAQYVDLLVPGFVPGGVKYVVQTMMNQGECDVLSLHRLKKGSPTCRGIKKAAAELGLAVLEVDDLLCPFLKVEGSFEDYFKQHISGKHRNDVRRKMKSLSASGDHRFQVVASTDELSNALDTVMDLDLHSWKGELEISIFTDENKRRFFKKLIESLVSQHKAILHLFFFRDRLLNYELAFRTREVLYLYATAYDPQFRKYSPGMLARVDQIKYCFENGIKVLEFGRCGYEHKKRWTNTANQNVDLYVFSPGFQGRLLYSWFKSHLALRKLKRTLKSSPEAEFEVITV